MGTSCQGRAPWLPRDREATLYQRVGTPFGWVKTGIPEVGGSRMRSQKRKIFGEKKEIYPLGDILLALKDVRLTSSLGSSMSSIKSMLLTTSVGKVDSSDILKRV